MKKAVILILFSLLLPILAGCVEREASTPSTPSSITWLGYEEGIQKGKQEGMPILVDFYADWCPPCKKMDEDTYTDARVIQMSQQFIMVKVNVDDEPMLSNAYKIKYIPTAVFLDSNGHEVYRKTGYADASQFVNEMEKALSMIK